MSSGDQFTLWDEPDGRVAVEDQEAAALDESFFPVLWDENGGRSAWLTELPTLP